MFGTNVDKGFILVVDKDLASKTRPTPKIDADNEDYVCDLTAVSTACSKKVQFLRQLCCMDGRRLAVCSGIAESRLENADWAYAYQQQRSFYRRYAS